MSRRLGLLAGLVAAGLLIITAIVLGGCAPRALRSQAEEGLALAQQLHWDACEDQQLLPATECDRLYTRLRALEEARRSDYTGLRYWIRLGWDAGRPYVEPLLAWAKGQLLAWLGSVLHLPGLAQGTAPALAERVARADIARSSSASGPQLQLVRRWTRPAKPQRVRLGDRADGGLGVLYLDRSWRLLLEDAAGAQLDSRQLQRGDAAHSPPLWAGPRPLWRDGTDLVQAGEVAAAGAWETYAGIDGAALAWQPCAARPCPAMLAWRAAGRWQAQPWARELFGVDALALSGSATGTAAVATREQPNASGWTLRQLPAAALRSGDVQALAQARVEVWRPPKGTSLEDPLLVRGASRAILIGTLYDLVHGPTGQVWAAEAGGQLRMIGQVGATASNAEIAAVEVGGVLYVAAEVDSTRAGLWAYRDRGLALVGTVEGSTPSCAAAEGSVWISSSAGLWVLK